MTPKRTIVGSHPHRRTLPLGREAVERALALLDLANFPNPARGALYLRPIALRRYGPASPALLLCEWLPAPLRCATRSELEAMLADYDAPAACKAETLEDLASDFLDACEAMLSGVQT